jgi:hypothetical protein
MDGGELSEAIRGVLDNIAGVTLQALSLELMDRVRKCIQTLAITPNKQNGILAN